MSAMVGGFGNYLVPGFSGATDMYGFPAIEQHFILATTSIANSTTC